MTFDEEIAAGFAELASEAGTAGSGSELKFKGVTVEGGGVLDGGPVESMRVDTKMGQVRRCTLMVARSSIAALPAAPKVGEYFSLGSKRFRIEDIEDEDPTDHTVTYLVKVSG